MAKTFEILEHTADTGIIAYGRDMAEAFVHAAQGLFSLITDLEGVRETSQQEVEVSASSPEDLLVDWLNELIYLFDAEQLVFRRFEVLEMSPTHLRARAYGEKVDPARHEIRLGVKAATYHLLKVEKNQEYRVQVIFDI